MNKSSLRLVVGSKLLHSKHKNKFKKRCFLIKIMGDVRCMVTPSPPQPYNIMQQDASESQKNIYYQMQQKI